MYNKVYVEIGNVCNMNCSFCHGHNRSLRQMNIEEFKIILNKLKKHTKYLYYHLMGEPLLHPQIIDFIKLANEFDYKSIITTNGTLLSFKQDEILESKIHKINISLHSFEDGSQEEYIKYLKEIASFAVKSSSVGTIVVIRLWNKGYDNGKNEFALKILKEEILGEWVLNSRGIKICDKVFIEFGDRFEWPDSNASIKGNRYFCYGLKDQFGILVDGTVVPCCLDSEGVINLGNIFNEDIDDILVSKRALDIVEGFKCGKASEDLCKRCGYAQRFVQ